MDSDDAVFLYSSSLSGRPFKDSIGAPSLGRQSSSRVGDL